MSQDRPQEDRQCDSRDAATPRLQAFMAASPNILPFSTFEEGTTDNTSLETGLPCFLPLYTKGFPGQYPSSGYASFPGLALPFLTRCVDMPSPPTPNPSVYNERALSRPEHKSPKEHGQQQQGRGSLPSFLPGYPGQGHKRSRLPSKDVARKAPRKAVTSSPPRESPPHSLRAKSIPGRGRPPKHRNGAKGDTPIPAQRKANLKSRATKPVATSSAAIRRLPLDGRGLRPPKVRSRPVVLDEDLEDEEDNEKDAPRASVESDEDTLTDTPPSASIGRLTQRRTRVGRPRPHYEYAIPKELEGVHRALGDDNWNEYLILQEQKWMGRITNVQFITKTRSIFSLFDETTRQRMEKRMADKVVKPAMEKYAGNQV